MIEFASRSAEAVARSVIGRLTEKFLNISPVRIGGRVMPRSAPGVA